MRISIPQEPGYEMGLNFDQMEPPHEELQSQQGEERNPNAYRSMRDYMLLLDVWTIGLVSIGFKIALFGH